MEIFNLNGLFIREHIEELIQLEDYVPISFVQYDKHKERDAFLESKNLLKTIIEMDQTIIEKCKHYSNPNKAWNSVLIEWIDCHPEYEKIIHKDSFKKYQEMKNSNLLNFNELLDFVELPSEKKEWQSDSSKFDNDEFIIKDDSSIQLPDFQKIDEIFDKYGASLLACYLSYLV